MKKFSALVLILTLIANCFTSIPVFSEGSLNDNINIIEFIKALNIVDKGYFESLDDKMTKGEMIELVVDFMDCETQADAYSGPVQFYDIDEADAYYKDICYAAVNGYCHGDSDGLIHAYDNATVFQAMVTFINALGLRDFALGMGFEKGYNTIARNTGISDGLTYILNQELTKETAIRLMYNVLLSSVYDINHIYTSDDANYQGYELMEDTSYLYERFKIYETEGIITAAPFAYIEGEVTEKGYVCVDSELHYDPNFYAENMIGRKVVAYVKENTYGINEIKYVCEAVDTNILTAFSGELSDYNEAERYYEYYPPGQNKAKTLRLTPATEFIYNGSPVAGISENIVNPKDGKLIFIDNDGDNKYDYVIVESFTTMFTESVNAYSRTIFDYVANYTLNYEAYGDRVYVLNSDGSSSGMEYITKGSVLTVAEGEDVLKIYVSNNTIYDMIQGKTTSGEATFLTMLDDVKYPVNDYYDLYCSYGQDVGQKGDFYLDVFGRITYMENSFYNNLGYVLDISSTGVFTDSVKLKLLNIYGKTEVVNLSGNVRIDGEKCDSFEKVNLQLSTTVRDADGNITATGLKNNIIIYELNDNNEVTSIETAYDFNNTTGVLEKELSDGKVYSKDDGIHMSYQLEKSTYNGLRSFDGKGLMSSAVKVFVIPVNSAGEILINNTEAFDVQSTGYFVKWSTYTANQYKISRNSEGADVVVVFENMDSNMSGAVNVMCVSSIAETLTEDGEIVKQFTGYVLGNEVTYAAQSPDIGDGIENGDMINLVLDSKQRVKAVEKTYDASSKRMLAASNSFANSFRVLIRPVYKIRGNAVITAEEAELPQIVNENDYEGFFIDAAIPVYKWDSEKSEVIRTDISEIVTYEQNQKEYSSLFLYTSSGNIRMAVIYD